VPFVQILPNQFAPKKEITMRDTLNEVDEYWTIRAFHIDVKKFTGIILSDEPWR
jgi:hypothetical protein